MRSTKLCSGFAGIGGDGCFRALRTSFFYLMDPVLHRTNGVQRQGKSHSREVKISSHLGLGLVLYGNKALGLIRSKRGPHWRFFPIFLFSLL